MSNTTFFLSLKYRENKRLKVDKSEGPVKGIVLALCCHHCCSWPQYVGRPFLQNLGFTGEDFHLLCCLSSWATCGIRLKKRRREDAGRTVNDTGTELLYHLVDILLHVSIRKSQCILLKRNFTMLYDWAGRVERRLMLTLALNGVQDFCFSCLKAFPELMLRDDLKAAKVKIQSGNNLQESTSLSCKTEFKIDAQSWVS